MMRHNSSQLLSGHSENIMVLCLLAGGSLKSGPGWRYGMASGVGSKWDLRLDGVATTTTLRTFECHMHEMYVLGMVASNGFCNGRNGLIHHLIDLLCDN